MKIEEVVSFLRAFGLNEYESKAYFALSRIGPTKATIISKESNIPPSKIYEVLESLINKKLVEKLEGRPKEFKAIPPSLALKNIIESKEKEIEKLRKAYDIIKNILKPIPKKEESLGIWMAKGTKYSDFFERAVEMLERCKKYVYAITRDYSRTFKLTETIKSSIKRGVEINLIGIETLNEKNYWKIKWYVENGVNVRTINNRIHPRMVLIDGKEVLIRLDKEPHKKKPIFYSLYSEEKSFVEIIDSYLKSLWSSAIPINF